jgi:hypothetical protein
MARSLPAYADRGGAGSSRRLTSRTLAVERRWGLRSCGIDARARFAGLPAGSTTTLSHAGIHRHVEGGSSPPLRRGGGQDRTAARQHREGLLGLLDPAGDLRATGLGRESHLQGGHGALEGMEADRAILRGHRHRGGPRVPRIRRRREPRGGTEQEATAGTSGRAEGRVPEAHPRGVAAGSGEEHPSSPAADGALGSRAGGAGGGPRRANAVVPLPRVAGGDCRLLAPRGEDRDGRPLRRRAVWEAPHPVC